VAKMPARRAPHLGEHTEDVLGELGFTARDSDGLRTGGAVRVARIPDLGFKRWPIWVWNHDLGEPGGQHRERGHQQHRECRNYDVHGTSLDIGSAQGIVGETTPLRIALFGHTACVRKSGCCGTIARSFRRHGFKDNNRSIGSRAAVMTNL